MTIAAPPRNERIKRVVRIPDEIIEKIDSTNNGLYITRADFVINSVREFAYFMIDFYNKCVDAYKDLDTIEDWAAAVDMQVSSRLNNIVSNMPKLPEDKGSYTTVMVYLPEGLESQIEYIIDLVPELKNTTVFTRVAVFYRVCRNMVEMDMVRNIEDHCQKRQAIREKVYVKSMRRNYKILRDNGEDIVDINSIIE